VEDTAWVTLTQKYIILSQGHHVHNAHTDKESALKALYAPYTACRACPLGSLGRTKVVFGSGNANAAIMLIGEGPGEQEDKQGLPFVGKSGNLLTRTLEAVGINRQEVYISNIVKCRPPHNRTPLPNEMKTCKDILLTKQIEIIKPRILCTLGAAALQGLLEHPVRITAERGIAISYKGIPLMPTLHPAYILRNPTKLNDLINDLLTVKKIAEQ